MQKTYVLTAPSPRQMQRLNDLINDCRQAEPIRLNFPADGDLFLFTCEGSTALSCIIVCKVQEDLWECCAFTRPDCRKRGLFSALLEKLCQKTPDDTELVFLLDHQSPDALAAVRSLEMELWRTEYAMECIVPLRSRLKDDISYPDCSFTTETICEEGLHGWNFSVFSFPNPSAPARSFVPTVPTPPGSPKTPCILVGSCRILAYDDSRFYLCHVEIHESFRNRGWGTRLILAALRTLPEHSTLSLHVSSENSAAVKLYQKTGFRLTETLSYYLY